MSYSDWQADTIRRALNRYRYNAGKNGCALPLTKVHALILLSDSTTESRDLVKYEVVRRFATSDHSPEAQNLNSIKNFLIQENYLSEEELDVEASELEEILAIQAHLANFDSEAKAVVSDIKPDYLATVSDEGRIDKIMLRTWIDKSGCFFRVEEYVDRKEPRIPKDSRDTSYTDRKFRVRIYEVNARRKGFGFVSTSLNLIYIFVKGPDPRDRVTYVQAWSPRPGIRTSNFFAIRNGRENIHYDGLENQNLSGPVAVANVYKFVPHNPLGATILSMP